MSPPDVDPPCFPSSATVHRADGATAPLSSLSAGDSILAAAADGTLAFDGVRGSRFICFTVTYFY